MNKKTINEFHGIISRFEIILYAIKWHYQKYNTLFEYEHIIKEFETSLRQLRILCFNNLEDIDD